MPRMTTLRVPRAPPVAAIACALLAACANLPATLELGALENSRPVTGSPTELYTRVARGALACWFSAGGVLKASYFYHAEAEPLSRGGASEIVIHVRGGLGPSLKGLRAFRVAIKPKGESAEMEITNYRLPDLLGNELKEDVERWAAGEVGCRDVTRGADWAPRDPNDPEPVKPPPPKKGKNPSQAHQRI